MPVYLDNSATTRPSAQVAAEVARALEEEWYNPSSLYAPALGVEKRMRACREKIAGALCCKDAKVIFTSGGTEANNLALAGTAGVSRAPVRIAVSAVEHPSVYECAKTLAEAGACETVFIPVLPDGRADADAIAKELQKGLTLLSVMQVNNETGAVNDIPLISRLRDQLCPSCRLHVDGVQGFMREEIDFNLIDMYTLSGHKLHAPKGTGALVTKRGLRLRPSHIGGGQEEQMRSGTENTPGILGLSRAIDEMLALPDRRAHMARLKMRLSAGLKAAVPASVINGPRPEEGACHILNVSFPGVRGETMLHALEEKGVYVGNGSACSSRKTKISRVLSEMRIPARTAECAVRFSLCPYTSEEDIDTAVREVKQAYEVLVKYQRR